MSVCQFQDYNYMITCRRRLHDAQPTLIAPHTTVRALSVLTLSIDSLRELSSEQIIKHCS